ncbi:MAG: cation-transporting P-type ATPase, partial [Gammaproteobacteria bacterium]|nr:cation-transporting P-type ATPase [Gammaproteobacteria bacterium]
MPGSPAAPSPSPAWHALPTDEVLAALQSDPAGLAGPEAAARLGRDGPNQLPRAAGRSALRRLLQQFHNLLIYVLLAAAILAIGLGHLVDAAVILAVVILNALIGFIQEGRAERALEAI